MDLKHVSMSTLDGMYTHIMQKTENVDRSIEDHRLEMLRLEKVLDEFTTMACEIAEEMQRRDEEEE